MLTRSYTAFKDVVRVQTPLIYVYRYVGYQTNVATRVSEICAISRCDSKAYRFTPENRDAQEDAALSKCPHGSLVSVRITASHEKAVVLMAKGHCLI